MDLLPWFYGFITVVLWIYYRGLDVAVQRLYVRTRAPTAIFF